MSRWLNIARAAKKHSGPPCHVPLVPLVPKAPLTGPNGTIGTNGTWHKEAEAAKRRPKETTDAQHDASLSHPPETDRTAETLTDKDVRCAHLTIAPDLSDPEDIRAWLLKRAAMRESSGTGKIDADRLSFDNLLWIWHAANPVTLTPSQCAACGTAFEPLVMSLPDGAQVCDTPDHACLIAYGNGRRTEAVKALRDMGIEPPAWWEL